MIGFAFDSLALEVRSKIEEELGVKVSCITALADLMMGDLLKNTRTSQVFGFCGKPDIEVIPSGERHKRGEPMVCIKLRGLDVFDPVTLNSRSLSGDNVPMWMVDPDYDGLCFVPGQVFFPRTEAWDNLKTALRGEFDETEWEHLRSDTSAPFVAGETVAVKVIDDRGNEFMATCRPDPE